AAAPGPRARAGRRRAVALGRRPVGARRVLRPYAGRQRPGARPALRRAYPRRRVHRRPVRRADGGSAAQCRPGRRAAARLVLLLQTVAQRVVGRPALAPGVQERRVPVAALHALPLVEVDPLDPLAGAGQREHALDRPSLALEAAAVGQAAGLGQPYRAADQAQEDARRAALDRGVLVVVQRPHLHVLDALLVRVDPRHDVLAVVDVAGQDGALPARGAHRVVELRGLRRLAVERLLGG